MSPLRDGLFNNKLRVLAYYSNIKKIKLYSKNKEGTASAPILRTKAYLPDFISTYTYLT